MVVAWMAYATLLTALLAAGGIAAEAVARLWSAPRRFVWLTVLALGVCVPPSLAWRPRTSPTVAATTIQLTAPASTMRVATRPQITPTAPIAWHAATRVPVTLDIERVVLRAWVVASAILFGLFGWAVIRLRIQSRSWRDAFVDGIHVSISSDVGPAVVGTLRPRIVVAAWTLGLDDAKRALMLRHELEHIRARDPLLLRIVTLSLILFPWNAALWLVVRRLRESVEIDCDRRVLGARAGSDEASRDYGMLLLLVGARRSEPLPIAAAFAGFPPFLERRIKAMTTPRTRRPTVFSIGLVSIVLASTVAATRAPLPASLRPIARRLAPIVRRASVRTWSTSIKPVVIASPPSVVASPITVDSLPPLAYIDTNPAASHNPAVVNDAPFELAPRQGRATSRAATGRVLDAESNAPLANVYVRVIGIQALNEPNWTCSDANGVFRLQVPQGEAWLSAQASDHEFDRITLAADDSIAVFRGPYVAPKAPEPLPTEWVKNFSIRRKPTDPVYVVDGVVVGPTRPDSALLTIRTENGTLIERTWNTRDDLPRLFINGVEVPWGAPRKAFTNPCEK